MLTRILIPVDFGGFLNETHLIIMSYCLPEMSCSLNV